MISIGDLKNQAEELKKNLKRIKFQENITVKQFQNENPQIFLQIIHHTLVDYSEEFYKHLLDKEYDMFSKTDLRFMEMVFKMLNKEFKFKPNITLNQFFTVQQYLEQKLILVNDIIKIILEFIGKMKFKTNSSKISDQPKGQNKQNENHRDLSEIVEIQSQLQDEDDMEQEEELEIQHNFKCPKPLSPCSKVIPEKHSKETLLNGISNTLDQINNFDQYFEQNTQNINNIKQNAQLITQEAINMHENTQYRQQYQQTNAQTNIFSNINKENINDCNQTQYFQEQQNQQKIFSNQSQSKQNEFQQVQNQQNSGNIQNQNQQIFQQIDNFNDLNAQNTRQINNTLQQPHIQPQNISMNQSQQFVTRKEMNQMMEMIKLMNLNVQQMVGKFDNLQNGVGKWVQNVNAQLILLDNQVKMMKNNQYNRLQDQ